MIVQIGIQVLPVETVDGFGVSRIDVSKAHVLADHRAIFSFHQTIVVASPGTALGLLDQQFVQQCGDGGG